MQQFLQRMLEAEVDEALARDRFERRGPVDAPIGYRNGFGKPRRLSLNNGTIVLCRPRVRGLAERFESRLLPAFKRRTEKDVASIDFLVDDALYAMTRARKRIFPAQRSRRSGSRSVP
jgi:hypothetical protein